MIYINLLLIAIIWVCIIDISGFIDSIKYVISWILTKGKMPTTNYELKPITCSLCMTTWTGLIYLICVHSVSFLSLAVLLLISVSTPIILDIITLLQDIITTTLNKIRKLL